MLFSCWKLGICGVDFPFSEGEFTAFWPLVGFYRGVDLGIGASRNEAMVSSRKQANIVYIPCVDCVRSLI